MGAKSIPNLSGLSKKQIEYLQWLASDKYKRIPSNKAQFAEKIGVTDRTLRNWENKPEFRDALDAVVWHMNGDAFPQIMQTVTREALKGSYKHLELWLRLMGILDKEQTDHNVKITVQYADDYSHITPAARSTAKNQIRA